MNDEGGDAAEDEEAEDSADDSDGEGGTFLGLVGLNFAFCDAEVVEGGIDVIEEGGVVGVASSGVHFEHTEEEGGGTRGEGGLEGSGVWWRFFEAEEDGIGDGFAVEGGLAGDEVIHGGAEGVDIGWGARGVTADDFRGDIKGGTPDFAWLWFLAGEACEAEIGDLGISGAVEEDIGGFDIAVCHSGGASGFEAHDDLACDGEDVFLVEDFSFGLDMVEAVTIDEFHNDVGLVVLFAVVVDLDDIGVIDGGEGAGFLKELGDEGAVAGDIALCDLDGDGAAEGLVIGAVDGAHTAFSEHLEEDEVGEARGHTELFPAVGAREELEGGDTAGIDGGLTFGTGHSIEAFEDDVIICWGCRHRRGQSWKFFNLWRRRRRRALWTWRRFSA